MLSEAELQKHIEATLAPVPAKHKNVILGYADTTGVVRLTYARRVHEASEFGIVGGHTKPAGWQAGAFLKASW